MPQRAAQIPVETINVEQLVRSAFGGGERKVDFENPTRIRVRRTSPRAIAILAASALLVAAAGFSAWNRYLVQQFTARSQTTQSNTRAIDRDIQRLAPDLAAADEFQRWQDSRVNWKEQIQTISTLFNETEDLYVVRLQMDSPRREDQLPSTRLEGRAKSANDVLGLTRDLVKRNPRLSVQPNGIEPSTIDSEYKSQFRLRITEASRDAQPPSGTESQENQS